MIRARCRTAVDSIWAVGRGTRLLGFFLQLFGANPDAPFAEWLYRGLRRVMAPFRGLFEPVALDGRSVLDVSILFAMLVYAIVGLALHAFIEWLTGLIVAMRVDNAAARGRASTP